MGDPEDDRWRHPTQPAGPASRSAPTQRDTPTPSPAVRPSGPFDPPRRDRYEEKVELGRGGMGRVFEAHDTALDRAVAIKQSLTDDAHDLARFEREARITARLQHPGIVPVLDAGRDAEGRPYYIMRKIEGRVLADVIEEAASVEDKLALVPRVLMAVDAVAYAHARGVIHRDLKSWNVLLGPFGETLVIDWGLARELDSDDDSPTPTKPSDPSTGLTQAGQMFGTPGFMPPEQARGEVLDRRADVYALGALLFHILVGKRPAADQAFDVPEGVPAELVTLTRKAMEPDRQDRYADAGELAADLRRFTGGKLVSAHQYTVRELVVRWLRRHRLAVSIATIAAIALAVGGVFAVRRVIEARDHANDSLERAMAARASEAARADELLVERAGAIVTQEPTRALAVLKQLDPGSAAWQRALPIAQTAQAFGVGWGRTIPDVDLADGRAARFVTSPDDKQVVLVTHSALRLVDPTLRTPPREIAKLETSSDKSAVWVAATNGVAVLDRAGVLQHVDLATGVLRPLQIGGAIDALLVPSPDGRVVASVDRARLVAIDPAGGPPAVLLTATEPIRRAQRIDRGTVYATETKLWYVPDGAAPLLVREGAKADLFNAEPITRRLLTIEDGAIREWELGTAVTPRKSWKHPASAVAYAGLSPVAIDSGGVFWLNADGEWSRDRHASLYATISTAQFLVATTPSAMYLSMPGSLRMFQLGRSMEIGGRVDSQIALAASGRQLVGIDRSGVLRSWNLEGVLPTLVADEDEGRPIGWNDNVIWIRTRTGALISTRIEDGNLVRSADFGAAVRRCHGPGRELIVSTADPPVYELVDHVAQTRMRLPAGIIGGACSGDASIIGLVTAEGAIVIDGRAKTRGMVSFERPLRQLAIEVGWLVAVDDRGTLERIDLASQTRTRTTVEAVDRLAVEASGRVAFARGDRAWTWSGRSGDPPARVTMAERTVEGILATPAGLAIITADHGITVVAADGGVRSYQTGSRTMPALARGAPYALITGLDQNLAVLNLDTGAQRYLPWWAESVMLAPDGQSVFGVFGKLGLISRSSVPHEVAKLRAWIHDATNAVLPAGSTRIDWMP